MPRAPTHHTPIRLRPERSEPLRVAAPKQPRTAEGGSQIDRSIAGTPPRPEPHAAASPGRTRAPGPAPARRLCFGPAHRERELSRNQDLNPDGGASSRPPAARHAWRERRHHRTAGCLGRPPDAPRGTDGRTSASPTSVMRMGSCSGMSGTGALALPTRTLAGLRWCLIFLSSVCLKWEAM